MSKGPFTVWVDYGCEGWKPKECATWEEAFDMVMDGRWGGPCRITREMWFAPVAEPQESRHPRAGVEVRIEDDPSTGAHHLLNRKP